MAPEQLRGEAADARTDIFAFGVVLFELVTGRRPFLGASEPEVCSAILRDSPPPLMSIRPDLPRVLERLIARCLQKRPDDRFPSATDLANTLRLARQDALDDARAAPRPRLASSFYAGAGPVSPRASMVCTALRHNQVASRALTMRRLSDNLAGC